jgi:hypothetical protein
VTLFLTLPRFPLYCRLRRYCVAHSTLHFRLMDITVELILARKRPSRKMEVVTPLPKGPRMAKRKRSSKRPQPQHKTKSTPSRNDKWQRLSKPNPLRQPIESAAFPLVGGFAGLVAAMSRLLDKRIADSKAIPSRKRTSKTGQLNGHSNR